MGTWIQQTREREGKIYLSCVDTAKLIRKRLKAAFPEVKFSVRSDQYSMGASIHVRWTDGPMKKQVEEIVGCYGGADFDGMVDLKTYNEHWLNADGTVALARSGGQGSTVPEYLGDPPGPTARLVSFGADYIFCERDASPERHAECRRELEEFAGVTLPDDENAWWRLQLPVAVVGVGPHGGGFGSDYEYGSLVRFGDDTTESASVLVRQLHDTRGF